jgi:hypothetical protein
MVNVVRAAVATVACTVNSVASVLSGVTTTAQGLVTPEPSKEETTGEFVEKPDTAVENVITKVITREVVVEPEDPTVLEIVGIGGPARLPTGHNGANKRTMWRQDAASS